MDHRSARCRPRLAQLASSRLLNAGPDACERIERQAIRAMKAAEWDRARKLLQLRIRMNPPPGPDDRNEIDHILELIDEAHVRGIGPAP